MHNTAERLLILHSSTHGRCYIPSPAANKTRSFYCSPHKPPKTNIVKIIHFYFFFTILPRQAAWLDFLEHAVRPYVCNPPQPPPSTHPTPLSYTGCDCMATFLESEHFQLNFVYCRVYASTPSDNSDDELLAQTRKILEGQLSLRHSLPMLSTAHHLVEEIHFMLASSRTCLVHDAACYQTSRMAASSIHESSDCLVMR